MTDLGPLFYQPPAVQHSRTSLAAADAIKSKADTLRAKVLRYLREHGPASDEQIQEGLQMAPNTERPRRIECVSAGLVRPSSQEGRTRSGRRCVLWEVVG